ncbi:MAG: hypothetical protein ACC628_10620 [Pirellulaceae bacterium]
MTSIRFVGDVPLWAGMLLALLAGLGAWWYYRRESRDLPGRLRWLLPLLRAMVFFLAVMTMTGPVLHHRQIIGQLGRVVVFVDTSQSMGVTDKQMPTARKLLVAQQQDWLPTGQVDGSQPAASNNPAIPSAISLFDDMSRWRRAENNLLNDSSGILAELSQAHDVELIGLVGSKAVVLWDSRSTPEPPVELGLEPSAPSTDLGSGIRGEWMARDVDREDSEPPSESSPRTAVVLLSDGRHNSGVSPLQAARVLGGQSIPIYAIGYGCRREPPDLALLEVEHPDMVFQKDRIRGTVVLKDQMPPGQPFVLQIGHENEVLWQSQLTTQDVALRRVDFEFSVDSLVDQLRTRFDDEVRHHALPLALQISVAPLDGETETANNTLQMRFSAITQSYRLLLIDGRSRWETRYLRNVFQRDEQWHVDTILVGPTTDQATLPRGDEPDMFPTDKRKLFEYDLILFGEVPPGALADYELAWIRDFVERRGGGIVFIDGQRGQLRMLDDETFGPLLPVSWIPQEIHELPARLQLTDAGRNQSALMLKSSNLANERFWETLPPPHRITAVEAVPGTEVLAEAWVGNRALPVLVTRSFGAGRVLYFGFDETWRWRYKVADTYHQRFWNQVAKWVMQRPFAVSDEYVSLDSGPPSYDAGELANLRVRLKGPDGRPVSDATVDALLWKDGRMVSAVSLVSTESGNGIYRGRTGPLAVGEYEVSVRAAGYANEALKARTQFVVVPPKSGELQQVACHVDLLRELASASGGAFLREEEIGELPELLRPLSSGHVVESDTLLWQSYWWFSTMIALLAVEWFLRKRAGLL